MSEDRPEHRGFVRVEKRLVLEYRANGAPFRALVTDLGEGGAFVDTPGPLPPGTDLTFTLDLDDAMEPITGRARVAWRQETVGMGIEFLDLSDDDRQRLRFFVASVFFG